MPRAVAVVFILDGLGRFFYHQRRFDRALFPGGYGLGAGGKVEQGETIASAAERELYEETTLRARPVRLFDATYRDGSVVHAMHVHELVTERTSLPNNDAEWLRSGWAAPGEVDAWLDDGLLSGDTAYVYRIYRQRYLSAPAKVSGMRVTTS
ncbi:hypothetical protein GCM10010307_46180 [Streptomyces vastus]|uniref:Nudix hydrolase domain-containing protein n=1 Tax=Streptomyces vastus TaxID=285451 RepID=A0ABN3R5Y4_9ACTN